MTPQRPLPDGSEPVARAPIPPRSAALLAAAALALVTTTGASGRSACVQEPSGPQVFRSATSLVEVDAVVTGPDGAPILDLTAADFQVRQNGKRQSVSAFTLVRAGAGLPPTGRIGRPPMAAPGPDPSSPADLSPTDRVFVLVLDDYHPLGERTALVRRAAHALVDRLAPDDLAAVVVASDPEGAQVPLTRSREAVRRAIDRFDGLRHRFNGSRSAPLYPSAEWQVINTLRRVADRAASFPTRRLAVVFLSEGMPLPERVVEYQSLVRSRAPVPAASVGDAPRMAFGPLGPDPGQSRLADEEAAALMASASRGRVSIYALDPRGPAGTFDEGEGSGGPASWTSVVRASQLFLRRIAGETGGRATVETIDLVPGVEAVVRDMSAYYLLGFEPSATLKRGRFYTLDVRVTRPGAEVRARKGFVWQ